MRIILKIRANDSLVPFDHQHRLVGTIQKWLGRNEFHGNSSPYCFSRINGGQVLSELKSLLFADWADMFIGAHDEEIVKQIVGGIRQDPDMFQELRVQEVIITGEPDLSRREIFLPAGPILLKRWRNDGGHDHIIYTDQEANALLTEHFRKKLQKEGIEDPTASAVFAPEEGKAKSMLISYRGIKNRCSWCPVRITGTPETKLFAWNTGIGNSTGIGFGAIK